LEPLRLLIMQFIEFGQTETEIIFTNWCQWVKVPKGKTMRMLDNLKEVLEDIETENDEHHRFIQNMLIQKEQYPAKKLTKNQFKYLSDLHEKYINRRNYG